MSNDQSNLVYALGFVAGHDIQFVPSNFLRKSFPIPLYVHPETTVASARHERDQIAIIGVAIHPEYPELDRDEIARLLAKSGTGLQAEIDRLVGRFAIIADTDGRGMSIQTDAIGMRTVYFCRRDGKVVVASSARLAGLAGFSRVSPAAKISMKWGYAGIRTPFRDVLRLPPNVTLDLANGHVRRFFPREEIEPCSPDECWDFAFARAHRVIGSCLRRKPVLLSLTAGLDSRTTLAATRGLWQDMNFFTYERENSRSLRCDARVSSDIAHRLNLRHRVIDYTNFVPDPDAMAAIAQNTFSTHGHKLACAYLAEFGSNRFLHIRTNLLELGRSNLFDYHDSEPAFSGGPATARQMAEFYAFAGNFRATSEHEAAFEEYVQLSNHVGAREFLSPWDLFFIEHRMGAWHAGVVSESDIAFESIVAFNSREVIKHMLGVSQEVRATANGLRTRLSRTLTELADIPINPSSYARKHNATTRDILEPQQSTTVSTGLPVSLESPQIPCRRDILDRVYRRLFDAIAGSAAGQEPDVARDIERVVPHPRLRLVLESDPALAAILPWSPCRVSLGTAGGPPFRYEAGRNLLQLAPALLDNPRAMAVAARWGFEAALAVSDECLGAIECQDVLRFGSRLIAELPQHDRGLILSLIPEDAGEELQASAPGTVALAGVQWLAGLLAGVRCESQSAGTSQAGEISAPLEDILVAGGDSRLILSGDPRLNKYGVPPRPRPEAIHFSSSTVSAISDYGYAYDERLRRQLVQLRRRGVSTERELLGRTNRATGVEVCRMLQLKESEADFVVAPSGTDTELISVMLALAGGHEKKVTNLLISPEESGRGVKLAGAGLYFDDLSATGAEIEKASPAWPDTEIELKVIRIRDADAEPLAAAEIDAEFVALGRAALASGHHVVAHVLWASKTGLVAPSESAVRELKTLAPSSVDIVVDACQLRTAFGKLGSYLRQDYLVQVTGSKYLTGPPFSGALVFPRSLRDRLTEVATLMQCAPAVTHRDYWSSWWSGRLPDTAGVPSFGPAFRWFPALLEASLFRNLPRSFCTSAFERFRDALTHRVESSPCLLPISAGEFFDQDQSFARRSIVSFQVSGELENGERSVLGANECRWLFEQLNLDAEPLLPGLAEKDRVLARQRAHIGQPVTLQADSGPVTVLRLVIGARFFSIVGYSGAGALEAALDSEIADAQQAIAKIELLAANWSRLTMHIGDCG